MAQKLVPVETTVDILQQVCRGLILAHSEDPPIIHRDIKPQNILIGIRGGRPAGENQRFRPGQAGE